MWQDAEGVALDGWMKVVSTSLIGLEITQTRFFRLVKHPTQVKSLLISRSRVDAIVHFVYYLFIYFAAFCFGSSFIIRVKKPPNQEGRWSLRVQTVSPYL